MGKDDQLGSGMHRILFLKAASSPIQVCVCPEYVLIPREHQNALANALSNIHKEFYPEGAAKSSSYGRLVNEASAKRVGDSLKGSNGKTVLGGQTNGIFMEPTVLTDVTGDDEIMQNELFAPLLSIVPVDSFDEAIAFINDRFVHSNIGQPGRLTPTLLGHSLLHSMCLQKIRSSRKRLLAIPAPVQSFSTTLWFSQVLQGSHSGVQAILAVCPFHNNASETLHDCRWPVSRKVRFRYIYAPPRQCRNTILVRRPHECGSYHAHWRYRLEKLISFRYPPFTVRTSIFEDDEY